MTFEYSVDVGGWGGVLEWFWKVVPSLHVKPAGLGGGF